MNIHQKNKITRLRSIIQSLSQELLSHSMEFKGSTMAYSKILLNIIKYIISFRFSTDRMIFTGSSQKCQSIVIYWNLFLN
jgi:hypothetical protein